MKPRGAPARRSEQSLAAAHAPEAEAISTRRKATELTTKTRWVLGLFFSVFFFAGVFATYALGVRPWLDVREARNWQEVKARIISSEVESHSDDTTTYSVAIKYTYRVNGRNYTGDQYDFTAGSTSARSGVAEIAERFREGKTVPCYVNPKNPEESVLERREVRDWGFGFIPLVFVLAGGAGIYFAIFGQRKKPAEGMSRVAAASFTRSGGNACDGFVDARTSGPVELKPAQSRGGALVAVVIFALFWNGIVSVFLVNIIGDAMRGGAIMWVFLVFLLPFVAIGLFMIGLAVRQTMALANPVARLTVNRGAFAPGETVELSWRFDGKAVRLNDVRLFLEGREEATYRRGTDTRTDKEVFATLEFAAVTGIGAGQPGTARLKLPERTMHSFKSKNNAVVWALRVKGGIAWWPDLDEEFAFSVTSVGARFGAAPHPSSSEL
jgi:hypothetical protein